MARQEGFEKGIQCMSVRCEKTTLLWVETVPGVRENRQKGNVENTEEEMRTPGHFAFPKMGSVPLMRGKFHRRKHQKGNFFISGVLVLLQF